MSFLHDDEYNIIMDIPATGPNPNAPDQIARAIPLDDLKRLRDAGAQTVLEFVSWRRVEPQAGVYDWSFSDEQVSRCMAAGMKVLIMAPNDVPAYFPDDWYVKACDGTVMRERHSANLVQSWSCLSPWNVDAQLRQNDFIERLCERYNGNDSLCIFSHSQEGESLLPPAAYAMFDDHAIASYRKYAGDKMALPNPKAFATQRWLYESLLPVVVTQQTIYCRMHPAHECWLSLHPVYTSWPGSGVHDIYSYFAEVMDMIQPRTLNWLIFSWFSSDFQQRFGAMAQAIRRMGVNIITGSEWSQGLIDNTPKAIQSGFRALLTAPLHPYLAKEAVEPWEFDAFRASHQQFMEANA